MKIFQYAAIYHPTSDEKKSGKKDELIVPLTDVLAADLQSATLLAGRAIPEQWIDRLSQIEVAVRPF